MTFFCRLCSGIKVIGNKSSSDNNDQYGVTSMTGYKPSVTNWINQDSFLIHESSDDLKSGRHIYAVFDGHGQYGHEISTFCRDQLLDILSLCGNCVIPAFDRLQEALTESSIDIDSSGTTCTIAVIQNGTIEVYNVGDSGAMIAKRQDNSSSIGFGFETTPITYDHTLDKEEEVNRILQRGGKVCSKSIMEDSNGENGKYPVIYEGPLRVWYRCTNIHNRSSMMGLAMTRSLGDAGAHKVGVSCEPFKYSRLLTKDDEFIVLASDGIWDVISYEDAASVINEYIISLPPIQTRNEWDPQEAANILVKKARRKWCGAAHIDDITCIVIKLKLENEDPCFASESI